ncbi:MAG: hypothetical protein WCR42_15920 [bacterium]
MAIKKVLITVKTYPSISSKYDELVCTAGFLEDGTWVRIYPIPFRKKSYYEQYSKYDWIEIDLIKNSRDFRPESYRPRIEDSEIIKVGHIDPINNWAERKKYVLNKVYYNLKELISEAKDESIRTSLAVFKPAQILDFKVEYAERDWDPAKIAKLEAEREQFKLFKQPENPIKIVRKLPYKFSYKLIDEIGTESTMMIEDWEIGQLFWNCLKNHGGDEDKAIEDVRNRYFEDFTKTKDLHLFLGTTFINHLRNAPNPFIIIGTFHPKKTIQPALF